MKQLSLSNLFNNELAHLHQIDTRKVIKMNQREPNHHVNYDQNQETITIIQGGYIRLFFRALIAIFFIIMTYLIIRFGHKMDYGSKISSVLISIYFSSRCYKLYKCIGSALLTMTPQGLVLPCFDEVIPWEQITSYQIIKNMHIKLKICLNPAFKLGQPKFCGAEIDYYCNKKENRIEITAYEIQGKIQLSDCIQLISKYKTLSEAKA